jgi:hypothetical protein
MLDDNSFPQYLSAPLSVLWFDVDTFVLIIIFFTIAFIYKGWPFFLLAVIGPAFYSSFKKRYPKGFLTHLMVRAGIVQLKYFPSPYEDDYHE